jgi:hypothetical protein
MKNYFLDRAEQKAEEEHSIVKKFLFSLTTKVEGNHLVAEIQINEAQDE